MALRCLAAALAAAALPKRVIPCLMAGLAFAPSTAPAQYMALTPPMPDPSRTLAPAAPKPVAPQGRAAEHAFAGTLPNQRTAPARDRVVRDICIGCDR